MRREENDRSSFRYIEVDKVMIVLRKSREDRYFLRRSKTKKEKEPLRKDNIL